MWERKEKIKKTCLAVVLVLSTCTFALAQKVNSSRRAALGQWWTTHPRYTGDRGFLGVTYYGGYPYAIASDGVNLWVGIDNGSGYLVEFRASDGARIGAWGGFPDISAVLVAAGRVWFTTYGESSGSPGGLYSFAPGRGMKGPAGSPMSA